jgi:hypothetical protein
MMTQKRKKTTTKIILQKSQAGVVGVVDPSLPLAEQHLLQNTYPQMLHCTQP